MVPSGFSTIAVHVLWAVVLIGRANERFSYTEYVQLEEQNASYTLTPIQLGAEVRGINLKGHVPPHVIDQIKTDVHQHGLLVFRDQGFIPADRHAEITEWFGPLKVTFKLHNAQQHPDVFRVSNEDEVGNGKSIALGWHIDGALSKTIISHSLFHIISISETADTWFTSLYDLVNRMHPSVCERYERLYISANQGSKRLKKPVIYSHPVTNKRVMLIYSGFIQHFIYDYGSPVEKTTAKFVSERITEEISDMIEWQNQTFVYKHKWQNGDFIIVDNQAVAHKAPEASSYPPEKVGLRLLHRASADSRKEPVKNYDPNNICFPVGNE